MSIKALSEYTIYSKYAHYKTEKKRRETWPEMVDRMFDMHERKYAEALADNPEFRKEFDNAKRYVKKRRVLGSQRALQFGGEWIEKNNLKIYNCLSTHLDRPRVFQEIMYALLCGSGVGFSVQKHHIKKLPKVTTPYTPKSEKHVYRIPDTIEGWADAVGVLMDSYFNGTESISFDYSLIRPKGSLVAKQFMAPGSEGLQYALEKIRSVIDARLNSPEFKTDEFKGHLRPIDCYDVVMHASDAVLSGGIRRSATLVLFSDDDDQMMSAKSGDWHSVNPQRARSNNSAVLLRSDPEAKTKFQKLIQFTKQFGEPGFFWVTNKEIMANPCVEIGMLPVLEETGESGFQGCNLSELNGGYCDTAEKFFECCKVASLIGTLQAGYTDFDYFGGVSEKIFERESLLGVSITGIMDNPDVLLDAENQKKGAQLVKKINKRVAKWIGINPAARSTCIKPSGTASCLLQTASGFHPHHARRYIRRVQGNRSEFPVQHFKKINPAAVDESVWSARGTDDSISFLCEVPKGAITKNKIGAVEFLEKARLTQQNWIEHGTNFDACVNNEIRHNVSITVVVKPEEWDDVEKFIYKNRRYFAGISLLPSSGDLDYNQAPFSTVLTPEEMVREYGDASVLASGLVVDGLAAFDGNLWAACDCALGIGEVLSPVEEPEFPRKNGYTDRQYNRKLLAYYAAKEDYDEWYDKNDWVRRFYQFSERYFQYDTDKHLSLQKEEGSLSTQERELLFDLIASVKRTTHCLKHVYLWHRWLELKREYNEIDWTEVVEENEAYQSVDEMGAQACAGGACEL